MTLYFKPMTIGTIRNDYKKGGSNKYCLLKMLKLRNHFVSGFAINTDHTETNLNRSGVRSPTIRSTQGTQPTDTKSTLFAQSSERAFKKITQPRMVGIYWNTDTYFCVLARLRIRIYSLSRGWAWILQHKK